MNLGKEQESKQGSVGASMLVPILRPACAKSRRDISVDPCISIVDDLRT